MYMFGNELIEIPASGNLNQFLNGQSTEQPEQLLFLLSQHELPPLPFRRLKIATRTKAVTTRSTMTEAQFMR